VTRGVRRVAVSLAAVTLASTTLASCGGDKPKADDSPSAGPCGLTTRRTGHLTLKNAVESLNKASGQRMTQRFRVDQTEGKSTVSMEGAGDSSADELNSMDLSMSGADGIALHLIYLDDKLYVSGEGLTPKGKFVPIDINDSRDPLAKPMKAYLDSADVTSSLNAWAAGLIGVKYVGKETLEDGSKTEFYEFNVDPRLAARAAGEEAVAGMPPFVSWYVWVDQWNLIHKAQATVDGGRTTMTFSGYCEPVTIKAPDKEDLIPR
jgi:hypothetical protein